MQTVPLIVENPLHCVGPRKAAQNASSSRGVFQHCIRGPTTKKTMPAVCQLAAYIPRLRVVTAGDVQMFFVGR